MVISTVSLQSALTYEMIVFTLCQLLPNFCNVYPNIGFTKKSLFFKTLLYFFDKLKKVIFSFHTFITYCKDMKKQWKLKHFSSIKKAPQGKKSHSNLDLTFISNFSLESLKTNLMWAKFLQFHHILQTFDETPPPHFLDPQIIPLNTLFYWKLINSYMIKHL